MPTYDLQQLSDLEQIRQLKARYCRFIDTKQWTRLAGLFVEGTRFHANAQRSISLNQISKR